MIESNEARCIAHLDMDAFYASVELARRPELRGRPVVVGGRGDPARSRGVVTTASYEARVFGVRSGMPLRTALARCPDAVFLPTDFDEYKRVSRLFKRALRGLAPVMEDRGIDEVYLDLTDVPGIEIENGAAVARELKHAVYEATQLTCSIGLAPNKLLAKMASELGKPDGLTVLAAADIAHRIWPLPVGKINGVGPKAVQKLAQMQIATIGELAAASPAALLTRFGRSYGAWLHEAAHGRDERPVVTWSEPRSRSSETTFERDLHPQRDRTEIERVIAEQAADVAAGLARSGYAGRTIGIKLRFDDFKTVTRDRTLERATADAALIGQAAYECLTRIDLRRSVRLMGVRVSALERLEPLDSTARGTEAREPNLFG
jgi:DNA polymerase-4